MTHHGYTALLAWLPTVPIVGTSGKQVGSRTRQVSGIMGLCLFPKGYGFRNVSPHGVPYDALVMAYLK